MRYSSVFSAVVFFGGTIAIGFLAMGCELPKPLNSSVDHCGTEDVDCNSYIEMFAGVTRVACKADKVEGRSYESSDFRCVVEACESNYVLRDNQCVQKSDLCSTQTCEENIEGWQDGMCVKLNKQDTCVVTSCDEDYFIAMADKNERLKDATAVLLTCLHSDLEQCGAVDQNCHEMPGWKEGKCIQNQCVAESCRDGYYLSDGQCEPNSFENCGAKGRKCVVTDNEVEKCDLQKGECVLDCNEGEETCDESSGGSVCVNLNEGNVNHCGGCNNPCQKVENAEQMQCSAGTCKIQKCEKGYHFYEDSCELDTSYNCGSHGNACKERENVCYSTAPLPYVEHPQQPQQIGEGEKPGDDIQQYEQIDESAEDYSACEETNGEVCVNGKCIDELLFLYHAENQGVHYHAIEAEGAHEEEAEDQAEEQVEAIAEQAEAIDAAELELP